MKRVAMAGFVRIPEGKWEEALGHVQAIVSATRAEPGCLHYAMAFDAFDKHLLRVFEVFENSEALGAHRASPHMAVWRDARKAMGFPASEMKEFLIEGWD